MSADSYAALKAHLESGSKTNVAPWARSYPIAELPRPLNTQSIGFHSVHHWRNIFRERLNRVQRKRAVVAALDVVEPLRRFQESLDEADALEAFEDWKHLAYNCMDGKVYCPIRNDEGPQMRPVKDRALIRTRAHQISDLVGIIAMVDDGTWMLRRFVNRASLALAAPFRSKAHNAAADAILAACAIWAFNEHGESWMAARSGSIYDTDHEFYRIWWGAYTHRFGMVDHGEVYSER